MNKLDKEVWTNSEMVSTFADTPHERHSIMVGFVNGLSEGSKFTCEQKYDDEKHYYAFGWAIGEIIDRLTGEDKEDSKQALAQLAGIAIKYLAIGSAGFGISSLL